MAEKQTNEEAYKLHLQAWKEAGVPIPKEEIEELKRIYKVGKYASKKGK